MAKEQPQRNEGVACIVASAFASTPASTEELYRRENSLTCLIF